MMVDGKLELRAVRSSLKLEAVEGQTSDIVLKVCKQSPANPPRSCQLKSSITSWRSRRRYQLVDDLSQIHVSSIDLHCRFAGKNVSCPRS